MMGMEETPAPGAPARQEREAEQPHQDEREPDRQGRGRPASEGTVG